LCGAAVCSFVHFGKWSRNKLKAPKCGAGEEWRKSFGPIELEIKGDSRRRGISYLQ
jgi:hypothetical protein